MSLDLIAFMAIWTGLRGPRPGPVKAHTAPKRTTKSSKPKTYTTPRGKTASAPKRQRKPTPAQLRAKGKPDLNVVQLLPLRACMGSVRVPLSAFVGGASSLKTRYPLLGQRCGGLPCSSVFQKGRGVYT